MIEKITLKNFKSHEDTTIELGQVTALVGPNGCGKTSVLEAIQFLSDALILGFHQLDERYEIHSLLRQKVSPDLAVSASGADETAPWEFVMSVRADQSGTTLQPKAFAQYGLIEHQTSEGLDFLSILRNFPKEPSKIFGLATTFKGNANNLRQPTSYRLYPKLTSEGYGLAPALNALRSKRKIYSEIEASLSQIIPPITEVNTRPFSIKFKERKMFNVDGAQFPYEEEREEAGSAIIVNTTSGNDIPAHRLSEGTVLTLGLLTLLYSSVEHTSIFLLEDIEQGLHPFAQRKLIKLLKEFAQNQNVQILVTSHSPYILDEFDAKDVWVMNTDAQGISHCKRLSEHPDGAYALNVLTTGELWGAEGEDWVLEKQQPAEAL